MDSQRNFDPPRGLNTSGAFLWTHFSQFLKFSGFVFVRFPVFSKKSIPDTPLRPIPPVKNDRILILLLRGFHPKLTISSCFTNHIATFHEKALFHFSPLFATLRGFCGSTSFYCFSENTPWIRAWAGSGFWDLWFGRGNRWGDTGGTRPGNLM